MHISLSVHHFFHGKPSNEQSATLDKIAQSIASLQEIITMNNEQLVSDLTAVKATLEKVGGEIDAFKASAAADTAALQTAIAGLEAELANAGAVSPAATALVDELKTLSAALDGKIDDLPATPA